MNLEVITRTGLVPTAPYLYGDVSLQLLHLSQQGRHQRRLPTAHVADHSQQGTLGNHQVDTAEGEGETGV